MTLGKEIYYLLIALVAGIASLVIIPKAKYKKFFIYGLLLGGGANICIILVLSSIFHLFEYRYLGTTGIGGIFSFFTPVAFMFIFMIFFYLLPVRKIFFYPYIIGFVVFAYMFGQLLRGLGLFKLYKNYQYLEPVTFLVWFSLAAWFYIKEERISLR